MTRGTTSITRHDTDLTCKHIF